MNRNRPVRLLKPVGDSSPTGYNFAIEQGISCLIFRDCEKSEAGRIFLDSWRILFIISLTRSSPLSDTEDQPQEPNLTAEILPVLPATLSQDERYFLLLITAIRKCKEYRPRFGQGRSTGISLEEFAVLYGADPFYHWLGLDSPLMYAAHKAAGGMTSIYRQIGIGSQSTTVP